MNENLIKWPIIFRYQKLSKKFIADNSEKSDWDKIFEYQALSEESFSEHSNKINWYKYNKSHMVLSRNAVKGLRPFYCLKYVKQ